MKRIWAFMFAALFCSGCRLEMHDQPKRQAYQSSRFFDNGASSRPLLPGTVARGALRTNRAYFAGLRGTNLVTEIPMKITREFLERGRERFDIYCSVCHGLTGEGNGMIVQRGFPPPPSFHIDRLRDAPVGHFFGVPSVQEISVAWLATWEKLTQPWKDAGNPLLKADLESRAPAGEALPGMSALVSAVAGLPVGPGRLLRDIGDDVARALNGVESSLPAGSREAV